jgi:two-component system, OmpR family, phosphate regulon sensor histidine kinase PhoR
MRDDAAQSGKQVSDLTEAVAERVFERLTKADRERILLEAIVENIPLGLAVVDENEVPLIVNSEALRAFGKDKPADFAGWYKAEAYRLDGTPVHPQERPIARTLATGEIVHTEVLELVIDGRRAIFEISTAPIIDASGERRGGLSIFRDVTVREHTERAERDFVTNAAHELQSPLAAIVSAVEVLQAGAKDSPQRDVFLGHIEREAARLARLVRALLILARTEIGVETPRDELVALGSLLEKVGQSLRVSSGVKLEIDCPDELAALTNGELLEQAVVNLAENAAKMTRSGRIVLAARVTGDGLVEISVSDTGAGITAADRQRIFERFYRAGPDESQGFGLGLAIVRAITDALAGELDLESIPGFGTTVRLRLPRAATLVAP